MMLPALLNVPRNDRDFALWSFNNQFEHLNIISAILSQKSVYLETYILDPIPQKDWRSWLWRHQLTHNDMNAVTGVAGNDLTDVNPKDVNQLTAWLQLHYQEHLQNNQILGL